MSLSHHYIARPSDLRSSPDMRQLDRLNATAGIAGAVGAPVAGSENSLEADRQIAQQFEALFIQQLLKQARQSSGIQGMFESDQTRLARSLSDEQMALQLADPGIGLAQALLSQIRGGSDAKAVGGAALSSAPELAASRLPGLRSRIGGEQGGEQSEQFSSISSLIDVLAQSPLAQAAQAVFSAVKGAPEHIENFVSKMASAARHAASESGVPAQLILSQAALESGWGRREIRGEDGSQSYNLFGIKASPNWGGKVVSVMTTEYENGVARKLVQPFRAYGSYAESFADYARLISQNERYSAVVGASSAEAAAHSIQKAGYATDPDYAKKLISIMAYFRA